MYISSAQFIILIQLLLAHTLGDFHLQFNDWVKDKEDRFLRSKYLYFHAAVHFFLTWILLGEWKLWYIAQIIAITHLGIDIWKISKDRKLNAAFRTNRKDPAYSHQKLKYFLLDQSAHLIIILGVWLFLIERLDTVLDFWSDLTTNYGAMTILTAYALCTLPVSIVINIVTRKWQMQLQTPVPPNVNDNDLDNAGMWIGMLERIIILTLIIAGQYESIGFLIAAKSLLRFSENNQQNGASVSKKSEYILIGTLLSYGSAIVIGALCNLILKSN